jgi:multiple sugar transport system ATP-binding protein
VASVQYDAATRLYPGTTNPAVKELDLTIADGELLVLVGPSGSGKSTALRMLAGLEPLDEGTIMIGGKDVSNVRPRDRDIAMVFQSYALYPQLNVAANMGFALKQQGVPKEERLKRVREVAKMLDLEPYLDRKPRNLSGGQRQRVAMGRAIVRHPQVYLMDEPLSNLDAKLRVQTRTELVELQQRLAVTTVYVTHDQVEAMTMGHRVAVLREGELQQCDAPGALYHRPANRCRVHRLARDEHAAGVGDRACEDREHRHRNRRRPGRHARDRRLPTGGGARRQRRFDPRPHPDRRGPGLRGVRPSRDRP